MPYVCGHCIDSPKTFLSITYIGNLERTYVSETSNNMSIFHFNLKYEMYLQSLMFTVEKLKKFARLW